MTPVPITAIDWYINNSQDGLIDGYHYVTIYRACPIILPGILQLNLNKNHYLYLAYMDIDKGPGQDAVNFARRKKKILASRYSMSMNKPY